MFEGIFNSMMPLVGVMGGASYDIWRPNYGQVDNTPVLIQSGLKFRVDPTTGRFSEPRLEGAMYYDVFGPTINLQSGDLLIRTSAVVNASGFPSSPDVKYPVVTCMTFDLLKSTVFIRTDRQARLQYSVADSGDIIYQPVYFDWLGQGFPGSQLNKNLSESLKIPSQRVVLYTRPNLQLLRTHFVEIDMTSLQADENGVLRPLERTWIIDEIDYTGPAMLLTLRNV